MVGLAGPYDVATFSAAAQPLFGTTPAGDPDRWRRGNPLTWVEQRPDLPVLLAHGDADDVVPSTATSSFARALREAGHPVREESVADADHADVYAATVIAPTVIDWVRDAWPSSLAGRPAAVR
jgi:fermentation-respiration switch protein FrsA (DUF1100 family)